MPSNRLLLPSSVLLLACAGVSAQPPARDNGSPAPEWTRGGAADLPALSHKDVPAEQLARQSVLTDQLLALSDLERQYEQHVATLANPFLEGRAPGTRGADLAGEYLEFWFRGLGLKPAFTAGPQDGAEAGAAGQAGSYRQGFTAGRQVRVTQARAGDPARPAQPALAPGVDFSVLGVSGTGTATGPLVFVGYGIEDGQDGYDSFGGADGPGADLSGKVALVLRFEPMDERGRSKWNQGGAWTNAAGLRAKLAAVAKRRPAAIVLVNPPGADDPRVGRLEDARSTRAGSALAMPVIMLSSERADGLLKPAGKTLLELRQAADERGGVIDLPGTSLMIEAGIELQPIAADNLGAILPGRGALADQYVVIGAHYDHLGFGAQSGSRAGSRAGGLLHPGADDNASGTAGMLLAAQILSARYRALPEGASARSIIFLGFSGEESGLLGAKFFLKNSPVQVSSLTAMLNMDMIGRVRGDRVSVSGTGSAENFDALIRPALDASGLQVSTLPGASGPSDHAAFYAQSMPVLHFFSGLHATYHMPEDYWWTVNTPGAVKIVNLVTSIAADLATRPEPLTFTRASGPSISSDDPDEPAHQPRADTPQPGLGGVKVRFGIGPESYDEAQTGVGVGEVYPGTSAADAGIKVGDRLTQWNGQEIKGVAEWMSMLASAKVGDVVQVTVIRDKQALTIPVTLKARDSGDR